MSGTSKTTPVLRKHMSVRHMRAVCTKSCLHIDMWLVEDEYDSLYLVTLTSIGGYDVLQRTWARVSRDGLLQIPDPQIDPNRLTERRINTAWGAARPWLATLHRDTIQPSLVARGTFKTVSARLHYVSFKACRADPTRGLENMYQSHGKGRHNVDFTAPRIGPPTMMQGLLGNDIAPAPLRLSRAERSRLRTLDKLLGLT